MKSKKTVCLILLAVGMMVLQMAAACAQTVEACPAELLKKLTAGQTFSARLSGYGASDDSEYVRLFFDLCEQVVYPGEEVQALQAGDTLIIDGTPCEVVSVDSAEGVVTVNEGIPTGMEFVFYPLEDGTYALMTTDEHTYWQTYITIECLVNRDGNFLYKDWGDPEAEEPVAYDLNELLTLLEKDLALSADNTKITFDEEGNLTEILRVYTPWN